MSLAQAAADFAAAYAQANMSKVHIIASKQAILFAIRNPKHAAPADYIGEYTAEEAEEKAARDILDHWSAKK